MQARSWFWLAAVSLITPLSALADGRPSQLVDHRPGARNFALELELGWTTDSFATGGNASASTTVHVLAPSLNARYAFSERAELTLSWPFAFVDISPQTGNGDSSFRSGNPVALLYYMHRAHEGYFRVGGGLALPVAHVPASQQLFGTASLAYLGSSAIDGIWSIWRYTPDRVSLVVPAQLEAQSGALVLGGDFGAGLSIYTGSGSQDAELTLQLAGIVGARVDNVTFGGRLQGVWLATQNGDNAQLALVPFVQADFTGGGFLYARFVINLDKPLGVFNDQSGLFTKTWGLFIGGGARL